MNLETFKARARRKLALPGRTSLTSVVPNPAEPDNMTPPTKPVTTAAEVPKDRFAEAMAYAASANAASSNEAPKAEAPNTPNTPNTNEVGKIEPLTGSSLSPPSSHPTHPTSSDEQLAQLRSLLLGSGTYSQHGQVEDVYQRTQADLNELRRDMDTRLTGLSNHVAKLEESLRSKRDTQSSEDSDQTAELLAHHDQRLDALDARITDLLERARSELGERRAANRDHLETKLAAITDHSDQQLQAVSQRLEASIASMQDRISAQLTDQSSTTFIGSNTEFSNLSAQLETVIGARIRSVNEEQTAGMRKLRDVMLAHTDSIKTELQAQTKAQNSQLAAHRKEVESQFNSALTTLNDNKVSHQELSQLLSRLADRIARL